MLSTPPPISKSAWPAITIAAPKLQASRADQRLVVVGPNFFLRLVVEKGQVIVVDAHHAEHPGHRGVGLGQDGGHLKGLDRRGLGTAPALGLQHLKKARRLHVSDGFVQDFGRVPLAFCALAQRGQQGLGLLHVLGTAEITAQKIAHLPIRHRLTFSHPTPQALWQRDYSKAAAMQLGQKGCMSHAELRLVKRHAQLDLVFLMRTRDDRARRARVVHRVPICQWQYANPTEQNFAVDTPYSPQSMMRLACAQAPCATSASSSCSSSWCTRLTATKCCGARTLAKYRRQAICGA